MSAVKAMSPLRRPMPGMPAASPAAGPSSSDESAPTARRSSAPSAPVQTGGAATVRRRGASAHRSAGGSSQSASGRWTSASYGATRLANFRLPIDLHDHYRELVRQVEASDPRLRRPSLTEVLIALMEEGPSTPEDVAALLRRRRASENAHEASR